MRHIKLTIEYDGTHFNGWQIQSGHTRTVQDEIEKALKKIFKKKIRCFGSGRTDSGVHALAQTAHFQVATRLPPEDILRAVNANLPPDIVIHEACLVPASFHAQYSAKKKTYRYTILNRAVRPAVERNFCLHVPHRLNLRAMRKEARALIGKKDFRAFMASDPRQRASANEKDTVRTVYRLDIRKREDRILIEITANGFLYKMVRNIVGTLLEIGAGRYPAGTIRQLLKLKKRGLAGKTAPAHGLCLVDVRYGLT